MQECCIRRESRVKKKRSGEIAQAGVESPTLREAGVADCWMDNHQDCPALRQRIRRPEKAWNTGKLVF
jgi:hypothetical protein